MYSISGKSASHFSYEDIKDTFDKILEFNKSHVITEIYCNEKSMETFFTKLNIVRISDDNYYFLLTRLLASNFIPDNKCLVVMADGSIKLLDI